jgi:hypothetical protein
MGKINCSICNLVLLKFIDEDLYICKYVEPIDNFFQDPKNSSFSSLIFLKIYEILEKFRIFFIFVEFFSKMKNIFFRKIERK